MYMYKVGSSYEQFTVAFINIPTLLILRDCLFFFTSCYLPLSKGISFPLISHGLIDN